MTINEMFDELENKVRDTYIVSLKYKYDFEEDYTIENCVLEYDSITDSYVWLDDWCEGQTDVEVVGYMPLGDVDTTKLLTCEDCVSREALDDAISDLTYWHFENDRLITGGGGSKTETVYKVDDVWRLTHVLPSVTPSRPKGHWIPIHPLQEDDDGAYMCSCCGVGNWGIDPKVDKYCFNCGADMRGSEEIK